MLSTSQALRPAILESAALRTLIYADIFDYPMTLAEVRHYLIGQAATPEAVRAALETACLSGSLIERDGFYCLDGRQELIAVRAEREQLSRRLWPHARRWGAVIAGMPFVRLVAVTGALAVNNALSQVDDIDLLIVTAPGRVWLTRALSIGIVHLARRFGINLCPNYVLSASVLEQSQRNLYVAHELAQMVPLSGYNLYAEMRRANAWTLCYLPLAMYPLHLERDLAPRGWRRAGQQLGERLLRGHAGDALERWERRRKQRKFQREAQHSPAAQLDADRVKGHFNDHGQRVLAEYERRLERWLIAAY